ncbi:coproporphyrinogen III oxidase [Actinoplanes philippinensis]|uniref:Heme chaperone HemW n=1 Tax=Actinoplanes philippinensis TaxID=35752 RepID=A0A1I2LRA2_9ACTN|nr:radical SAM family heme chaperone HemW [Actinoplanes philippinensis]GIE82650.1 coproporphyrinogen III oxidase [Actinoplanes philippinensis]SFF81108.1 oxygen-independent coproporphyrinogen-3 oxidase [Actinoplanes philippinensis]
MAGALPDGEPVPTDGSLPDDATREVGKNGFAVYVHVPFCASRCGYCDFNTYTAAELGGGASRDEYAETVLAELALAARVIEPGPVGTVFVGGGTPTLLSAGDLGRVLEGIDRTWGLAPGAEVTTEANPESVDPAYLRQLRAAGFTRISLGMQSAADNVLRVLDRKHTAGRAPQAATEAREAGFEHVNLDLIYGTPGESADDFARSLRTVVDAGVDHVSAYALIVEDGTRMAGRMRRGELPYPSDDVAADRYLAAEAALTEAGFGWYEVSNWARPGGECRHNLLYWTGADWWGLGPGAHSHVGGVRWWNVKHPSAYAGRLAAGASPGHARELLTDADRHLEDVMLRVRLREGIPLDRVDATGAAQALADGLLEPDAYERGRLVLTLRGRLLADAVVRDVL